MGPLDFRLGDCFKDFDPEATESTVVACTADHSAQLVAVHHYPARTRYPGVDAMKARAAGGLPAAALTGKANAYDLNCRQRLPQQHQLGPGRPPRGLLRHRGGGQHHHGSLIP